MTSSTSYLNRLLRACLSIAFWLMIWQCAALWADSPLFLPPPIAVLRRLTALSGTIPFWHTALLSLGRVLVGLLWGIMLGFVLAGLTCASRWADLLLSPAVRVVRATPVASFILLLFLWTDRDSVPTIIAALMVLPVVWGNVTRGIRERDGKLLELARAYRFSAFKTAHLVYMPSVRPYLLSAVTTSMGLAWKSGVAAEVLVLPRMAIGTHIYNTKFYFETADLFAWTLVVIVLSLVLEHLIRFCVRRLEGGQAI